MHLIFVHGSGNTGTVWRHQTDFLLDAEAVNLPGHLAPGEACSTVEEYSEWLFRYVTGRHFSRPVLAGHSLGGAIVLQYALDHPDSVGGLILVGTGAKLRVAPQVLEAIRKGIDEPDPWLKNFVEPLLLQIAEAAVGFATKEAGMDSDLRKALLQETARVGAAVQLNDFLCCDRFNVMDRLHEIRVPTLVLSGSRDVLTPPKYGQFLADHIQGSRHVIIEGGTHFFFGEKPEQTNRAIDNFLKGLPKTA
ncbi:MAG: alpha/beta hydrolase [Dehalococcoidia bacterium]|nr:alpha/beta hydrolase [Dehalococcoidia bacterium]